MSVHCTDEETEAQRDQLTCLGRLASERQSLTDPRFLRERIASRQRLRLSDHTVVGGGLVK